MQRRRAVVVCVGALSLAALGAAPAAADPDGQHGTDEGHLIGTGEFGKIDLLDVVDVTDTPDLIADVTVSPDGNTAFLANWGEPDCAGPETGGRLGAVEPRAVVIGAPRAGRVIPLSAQPQGTLREEGRGSSESRHSRQLRGVLVAGQIALSVSLLTGAGLLVRSFQALARVEPGFEKTRVLTFRMSGGWNETADYPALYVTAGLNDPRVSYHEPAKWVARLRAVGAGRDRLLLLRTEMGAGHGGPSGRYDAWKDEGLVFAFLLQELGVVRDSPTTLKEPSAHDSPDRAHPDPTADASSGT